VISLLSIVFNIYSIFVIKENNILRFKNNELLVQNSKLLKFKDELEELKAFKKKVQFLLGIDTTNDLLRNYQLPTDTSFYSYVIKGDSSIKYLIDKEEGDTLVFIWPIRGIVSQEFDPSNNHYGIDIPVPIGTPIRSAENGVILKRYVDSLLGKTVIVGHTNNVYTIYGHADTIFFDKGAQVFKGQVIGKSGNSGKSSAPHLHFGLSVNGKFVNPLEYLN